MKNNNQISVIPEKCIDKYKLTLAIDFVVCRKHNRRFLYNKESKIR